MALLHFDRSGEPAHPTPVLSGPPAGLALSSDHPLVVGAWIAAGLMVAGGLGPWLSKALGIVLPAFALVRTTAVPKDGLPVIRRVEW